MPYKINNSGAAILADGRLVSPGSFYDAPEEEFITTDNPDDENTGSQIVLKVPSQENENAMKKQLIDNDPEKVLINTENQAGENTESHKVAQVPSYEEITVSAMKEQLTEWEIDFSDHDKDKTTLYSFFEKEWVKRYADGTTD